MSKPIGMDEIMRTTVPLSVSVDSLNPDRVVPGSPAMALDSRLFSVVEEANPYSAPALPEAETRLDLVEAPTRSNLYPDVDEAEAVADKKFTAEMAVQIAELFRDEPEAQTFWTTRVEKALESADPEPKQDAEPIVMEIYPPELDTLATGVEPTMQVSPSTETDEEEATSTQIAVQTDSSDENTPPPGKTAEERTNEPEDKEDEEQETSEEPIWNMYRLRPAWRTAKESLKRRAGLGREIVSNAFSQEDEMPAVQIAAEAALLDLPGLAEHKSIFLGKLDYPTIQHEVALSAVAAGTSYAEADKAVQSVIYKKAPREKHDQQVFEEQQEQSKLVLPVRLLAEEGARVIVLRKRKHVWQAIKRRAGIDPVEFERAPEKAA